MEERRFVIVLFAQTPALSEMPEADRAAATDELFTKLRSLVETHGGHVDKFVGDVLIALWGAPVAHEDDAVRAVRAAIHLRHEARSRGLRCGLNAGEVLFGGVGGDRATATGDTVNVAQRLMAAAAPGQVLASRSVERLAGRAFRFRSMEALHVRGREQAVDAFEVSPPASARTELRLSADALAPLVGREEDLARLLEWMDARPACAVIVGEAGIGKSRLLAELRRGLRERRPDGRVLSGRSLEGVRLPLFAFGEIVRREAGARNTLAGDGTALAAYVRDSLAASEPDAVRRENASHLVAMSLGLDVGDVPVMDIEPAQMRREVHAAWALWLRAQAARGPLLVFLEDLHWADEGTLALASALRDAGVRFLGTSRPGARLPDGWRVLTLGDLGALECLRLAEEALGAPLSAELATFIGEKAGGNPYFVAEIARFLKTEGLVDGRPLAFTGPHTRVPESLAALLTSRIDALEAEDREVLKAASVIGRAFWRDLLGEIVGRDVGASLERSENAKLLTRDDEQYAFRHALLRDAAYNLLTRKERRRLHALVADRLEAREGRGARVMAARHREAAGQEADAARLWLAASRDARAASIPAESVAHAREAVRLGGGAHALIQLADSLNGIFECRESLEHAARGAEAAGADAELRSSALLHRAGSFSALGLHAESIGEAERTLRDARSPATRATAHLFRARSFHRLGRFDDVEGAVEAALAEIAAAPDPASREHRLLAIRATRVRVERDISRHQHADALARIEPALAEARALKGTREELQCLFITARALRATGSVDRALETFRECRRRDEARGDRDGVAAALVNIGNLLRARDDLRGALDSYESARAIYTSVGILPGLGTCLLNEGIAHARLGDDTRALAAAEEGLRIGRETGEPALLAGCLINRGAVKSRRGQFDEALADYDEAARLYAALGIRDDHGESLLHAARTLLLRGDPAAATLKLRESLAVCGHTAVSTTLARAELRAGRPAAALPLAHQAIAVARADDEPFELATSLLLAARASALTGDSATGSRLLAEALAVGVTEVGAPESHLWWLADLAAAYTAVGNEKEAKSVEEDGKERARVLGAEKFWTGLRAGDKSPGG